MIKFCGYNWLTQERWGNIHPEKSYVWYDESSVIQNSDEEIILLSKYSPKYFEELGVESKMGIGLISCTEKFTYGRFDLDVMLPDLPYSWPAFWMWSWTDWPPELDVFEGYSDNKGGYDVFLWDKLFKKHYNRLENNVHVRENGVKLDFPSKTPKFSDTDLRQEFNKYSVVWKPDVIEFYINDMIVRSIVDKKVLSKFENHEMNVIVNNSLYRQHTSHKNKVGKMIIKNFKYTSL
jgi:beta-glucanase (GH16 family)